jgi:single-strand DNA-binding protein
VNNATLIGNLTREAKVRTIPSGKAVAKFGIAVKRDYGDAVDFFDVEAWGDIAQYAGTLTKGTRVFVSGSLKTDSWDDKETGKKRTKTLVNASIIAATPQSGDEKKQATGSRAAHSPKTAMVDEQPPLTQDDIPF